MFNIEKRSHSEIDRVCITHTVYTLLQYLLLSSLEELQRTWFFFPDDKFLSFFPNSTVFTLKRGKFLKSKYLQAYYLLLRRNREWPFLHHSKIYAQDHLLTDFILLKGHEYILLEDGLENYLEHPFKFKLKRLLKRLPFYPNGVFTWGEGANCKLRLLSHEPEKNSGLSQKGFMRIDFQKWWHESEKEKQEFILRVFNVSLSDLERFEQFDHLLLTQCFSEAKMLSEEEKIQCYKNIIEHFKLPPESTIIKTHPSEVTDYSKAIPGFQVCTQRIPIELIAIHLKKSTQVYTVSSSGVFIFPRDRVTWCDTEFSPALKEKYGSWKCPF